MHPPQRQEIVLQYPNPVSGYPVLVEDGDRYFLYHNGYHGSKKRVARSSMNRLPMS